MEIGEISEKIVTVTAIIIQIWTKDTCQRNVVNSLAQKEKTEFFKEAGTGVQLLPLPFCTGVHGEPRSSFFLKEKMKTSDLTSRPFLSRIICTNTNVVTRIRHHDIFRLQHVICTICLIQCGCRSSLPYIIYSIGHI